MSDKNIPTEIAEQSADASKSSHGNNRIRTLSLVTISLCFVTLVAEFAMIWLTTNDPWSLGPVDALILFYMLGPVVALSVIAWVARNSRNHACGLSLLIFVVLGWGLWTMAEHTYRFHTDPDYRKLQAVGVFVVPVGQWLANGSLIAGIIFARRRETMRKNKKA